MYREITGEQIKQLERLLPTGFVIVIKAGEEHYALYQYVPDGDYNLTRIAEHLAEQFASNKAEIVP